MDSEEPMGERDAVGLANDQITAVPDDSASDLAADDGFLNENLCAVAARCVDRVFLELLSSGDLADAER